MNSNGIITRPINGKADVAKVIGISSTDWSDLCSSSNINKYSKYKPYKFKKNTELTDTDRININYGMSTFNFPLSRLASSSDLNSSFVWQQWSAPSGGENEPFRTGDFTNYNHNAVPFITKIELYNSETGGLLPIVTGGNDFGQEYGYYGKITFDNNADLKLTDFWTSVGQSVSDYYLTLVIGANIDGLDNDHSFFVQSEKTVGETINNRENQMQVYLDTRGQDFKDVIVDTNIGKNIVLLGFAKKWSYAGQTDMLSPQMWDNKINFYVYNNTYATIGDGGEGGRPPGFTVYGHMNLGTNTPYIEIRNYDSENIGIFYSQGNYPRLTMTSGQIANGILASLAFEYRIRNVDGSGSTIQGITSFTTTELISSNTQDQVYVNGPEGLTGFVGLINKTFFGVYGQYRAEVRIRVSYTSNSSAQRIGLQSDGQGQGIETEWQTITFNYNG